jgi:hypothetical protein
VPSAPCRASARTASGGRLRPPRQPAAPAAQAPCVARACLEVAGRCVKTWDDGLRTEQVRSCQCPSACASLRRLLTPPARTSSSPTRAAARTRGPGSTSSRRQPSRPTGAAKAPPGKCTVVCHARGPRRVRLVVLRAWLLALLAENAGCADARCLPQTRRRRRARARRVRASGAWRRARTMVPQAAGLAPRRQGPQAYLAGRDRARANAVTAARRRSGGNGPAPIRGRAAESARAWQAQQALRTACSQMRPRRQRGAWKRTQGSRTRAGEWGTWWFLWSPQGSQTTTAIFSVTPSVRERSVRRSPSPARVLPRAWARSSQEHEARAHMTPSLTSTMRASAENVCGRVPQSQTLVLLPCLFVQAHLWHRRCILRSLNLAVCTTVHQKWPDTELMARRGLSQSTKSRAQRRTSPWHATAAGAPTSKTCRCWCPHFPDLSGSIKPQPSLCFSFRSALLLNRYPLFSVCYSPHALAQTGINRLRSRLMASLPNPLCTDTFL